MTHPYNITLVTAVKTQVLITLRVDLFYSNVPQSHDRVKGIQHEQHHHPQTEAAKWNSAIFHFIIHTFAFLTCRNVVYEKGQN